MAWLKKNIVSEKGGYDTWHCTKCGYQEKSLINRKIKCPKCRKHPVIPLGWWNTIALPCARCGSPAKIVPKEGHKLSKMWNLQRNEHEKLYYCSGGCLEIE